MIRKGGHVCLVVVSLLPSSLSFNLTIQSLRYNEEIKAKPLFTVQYEYKVGTTILSSLMWFVTC